MDRRLILNKEMIFGGICMMKEIKDEIKDELREEIRKEFQKDWEKN